jgi:hypothetical protein
MKRKHFFNMIEIMLALGVCAIGITSIMVLIPVGSAASRDAAMETYAAHAADQMLHFMKYRITDNQGEKWDAIVSTADDQGEIEKKPLSDLLGKSYSLDHLNNKPTTKWEYDSSSWTSELKGTIYQNNSDKQIYQIISHRNPSDKKLGDTGFDEKVDFRGILSIWKEQIEIPDSPSSTIAIPYTVAVKLNVQVAWPAELPPTSRQVAYYSLEVFKP